MLIMLQESFSQLFRVRKDLPKSWLTSDTTSWLLYLSQKREVSDLLSLIIPIHLAPLDALISPAWCPFMEWYYFLYLSAKLVSFELNLSARYDDAPCNEYKTWRYDYCCDQAFCSQSRLLSYFSSTDGFVWIFSCIPSNSSQRLLEGGLHSA
jgi:hypothetical protein